MRNEPLGRLDPIGRVAAVVVVIDEHHDCRLILISTTGQVGHVGNVGCAAAGDKGQTVEVESVTDRVDLTGNIARAREQNGIGLAFKEQVACPYERALTYETTERGPQGLEVISSRVLYNPRALLPVALLKDSDALSVVLVNKERRMGYVDDLNRVSAVLGVSKRLENAQKVLLTRVGEEGIRLVHEEDLLIPSLAMREVLDEVAKEVLQPLASLPKGVVSAGAVTDREDEIEVAEPELEREL